jgi:hypothetical protein
MGLKGEYMAAIDFKKTQKELYRPGTKPTIVDVPSMRFFMVDGEGDPNTSAAYNAAIEVLYALSYAVKMSKLGTSQPEGYFDFVVPPLEGLWDSYPGMDTGHLDKSRLRWTSMIRQPDFVTPEVLEFAKASVTKKKPSLDLSLARFEIFSEGLCAQVMHLGSYDGEPATVAALDAFATESGYRLDFSDQRLHHEIYLGDPRKTAPEKLKTVIRHPIAINAH